MRRILYGLIITTTLLPGMLRAQEATPLSLENAMEYAVKNNVIAKNARLDRLIQQAKNAEITGLALPNLSAKGEFTAYPHPIKTFVPGDFFGQPGTFTAVQFTPQYSSTASATLSQLLFDGSVFVALQARNAVLKFYEHNERLSEEQVRYNVQKAYYSFVIAHRQFNVLKNSLSYARSMSNELSALYKEGFAEKIEVDRFNVAVNNLATDSMRIGNLIAVSEQLLKYQMGMNIEQPIVLTDTSVENSVTDARAILLNELNYNERTDYQLLQSQLTLNKYDLKRYKLAALPTFSAFGSAAYNYATNDFDGLLSSKYVFYSIVGLQLNVPIFDGLQRHNRAKQAKLNIEKTLNSIDDAKLGMDFQARSFKTTLSNSLLAMESQERNVELAQSVLELARKKYKEGVGSNLEVSQAQTEMLSAQSNYFNAMLDVMNAKSDLQKALGQFK